MLQPFRRVFVVADDAFLWAPTGLVIAAELARDKWMQSCNAPMRDITSLAQGDPALAQLAHFTQETLDTWIAENPLLASVGGSC